MGTTEQGHSPGDPIRIDILGKPGCHLCEDARGVIDDVVRRVGSPAEIVETSILDDPELYERYWDQIPVVLIDGGVHTIWRVDPERLAAALTTEAPHGAAPTVQEESP